jgi:hypothetical protein
MRDATAFFSDGQLSDVTDLVPAQPDALVSIVRAAFAATAAVSTARHKKDAERGVQMEMLLKDGRVCVEMFWQAVVASAVCLLRSLGTGANEVQIMHYYYT